MPDSALGPLLQEAGLVRDQHPVGVPQLVSDVRADVIADLVSVPLRRPEQPLQLVRCAVPGVFGQPPTVLPTNARQKTGDRSFAVVRGSTRVNRAAIRANASSNIDCHRTGFTLCPAATARSSVVLTNTDDHAVAVSVQPQLTATSRSAVGVLDRCRVVTSDQRPSDRIGHDRPPIRPSGRHRTVTGRRFGEDRGRAFPIWREAS